MAKALEAMSGKEINRFFNKKLREESAELRRTRKAALRADLAKIETDFFASDCSDNSELDNSLHMRKRTEKTELQQAIADLTEQIEIERKKAQLLKSSSFQTVVGESNAVKAEESAEEEVV